MNDNVVPLAANNNSPTDEDWYTNALNQLIEDGAYESDLTRDQFNNAYTFLYNFGLIDYDIEKDLLWDVYVDPDVEFVAEENAVD